MKNYAWTEKERQLLEHMYEIGDGKLMFINYMNFVRTWIETIKYPPKSFSQNYILIQRGGYIKSVLCLNLWHNAYAYYNAYTNFWFSKGFS